MSIELYYSIEPIIVQNPGKKDVEDCIQALDSKTRTVVHLISESDRLSIGGGKEKRVRVRLTSRYLSPTSNEYKNILLVDSQYSGSDEEIEMVLGGELDNIPLYETVTKETAIQVALFFLENLSLPDNVEWIGKGK